MDLSMLLSQAEMSYSKMNFYKNTKNAKKTNNQELFVQAFQQNLDLIQCFLSQKDIAQLPLVCRGVGYLFIVRDLWSGMKMQVADRKLQDIDDYEFVQQQPKQISKQDKKIRIHSLKKSIIFANIQQTWQTVLASNIKQKKLSMAVIDTELNPFQKTEIGFKRLLKTTTNPSLIKLSVRPKQQKNVDVEESMAIERLVELLEIPREYAIDDLIINPRDQWARNMQRAGNLVTVVSRWNAFHRRFWAYVMSEQTQLIKLMKKMIKLDGCLLSYKTAFQQQPLSTIINIIQQSAPKNALIEQQLNKLGKEFVSGHGDIMLLIENKQTEQLITMLHECYQKVSQKLNLSQLQPAQWIEGLNIIEEAFDNTIEKVHSTRLKAALNNSVANVFKELLYQHIGKCIMFEEKASMKSITLKFIIQNAEFCQLAFQILYSLIGKIANILQTSTTNSQGNSSTSIKMNQSASNFSKKLKPMEKPNQKMLTTLSKLTINKSSQKGNKSQKSLFGILWNISKYFDKLHKQLALKEKKKKQQQKVQLIKDFIKTESNLFGTTIQLICSKQNQASYLKSLANIQEYYKDFKVKIEQLKEEMGKTSSG